MCDRRQPPPCPEGLAELALVAVRSGCPADPGNLRDWLRLPPGCEAALAAALARLREMRLLHDGTRPR